MYEGNRNSIMYKVIEIENLTCLFCHVSDTTPYAPYNVSVLPKLFSARVSWIPSFSSSPQYFTIGYV